ncbi:hypothetical protein DYB32_000837 [Aphanomyces invadans]|uniref:Uncharacterized protein n=1 Tax=Aphanomyces invadans TaxID=157072 RepID=A0A3R6VHH7_9STRA|nr:hypothetical protein DYB32_000837 [Aphanomyces invadans]
MANQWHPPDGWPHDEASLATADADDDNDSTESDGPDSARKASSINNSIETMAKALAENESFVAMLQEKLGLKPRQDPTRRTSSLHTAPSNTHTNDSSDDDDQDDSDDTIAGRVLRMLAQDDSTQDTNTASVKRLTRLQIAKETSQVKTPGEGWKRLKPTRLPRTFARKVYMPTIAGPTASFMNQTNLPLIVGLLDPSKDATHIQPDAVPDFRHHIIPVRNLDSEMTAMKKVLAASAKKGRRSTIVQVFQDAPADELEAAPENQVTEAERIAKAVVYTRNNNVKENFRGNTGLHYCYEYKWTELASYLKEKGAKDDIPNAEGLMCYEGISSDNLQKI